MAEFCSQVARESGLPLYGTASETQVWLVLEYSGAWRTKAVDDNDLAAPVAAWFAEQAAAVQGRRLFIRGERRRAGGVFYVAVSREGEQRLWQIAFDDLEELVGLDVARVLAGNGGMTAVEETLVLVCTNGKRDQCCSLFGLPIFRAFSAESHLLTYQTTHLGGHCYAPVILTLPSGTMYGYVDPENVPSLAENVREGRIDLRFYRGRTFQSGVENSAEFQIRRHTENLAADGLTLVSGGTGNGEHTITFKDTTDDLHTVQLTAAMTDPVLVGCSLNKFKPQPTYTFHDPTILPLTE